MFSTAWFSHYRKERPKRAGTRKSGTVMPRSNTADLCGFGARLNRSTGTRGGPPRAATCWLLYNMALFLHRLLHQLGLDSIFFFRELSLLLSVLAPDSCHAGQLTSRTRSKPSVVAGQSGQFFRRPLSSTWTYRIHCTQLPQGYDSKRIYAVLCLGR